MKKHSKTPASWEVKRKKVVASAAFVKLFEKARKTMLDPSDETVLGAVDRLGRHKIGYSAKTATSNRLSEELQVQLYQKITW